MNLLVEADQPGNQLDGYISRLNTILSQKAAGILQLQNRLAHFQKRLREHKVLVSTTTGYWPLLLEYRLVLLLSTSSKVLHWCPLCWLRMEIRSLFIYSLLRTLHGRVWLQSFLYMHSDAAAFWIGSDYCNGLNTYVIIIFTFVILMSLPCIICSSNCEKSAPQVLGTGKWFTVK